VDTEANRDLGAVACRVLRVAQEIAGGADLFAARLSVSPDELRHWLSTNTPPPREVFDKALEILLDALERRGKRH
jgi:hypothetical protein